MRYSGIITPATRNSYKQLLISILSVFISLYLYSLVWGMAFSLGFILLLFTHEMGHFSAAKLQNINCTWPFFIPFIGAFINISYFPSKKDEAIIGIGGPLAGILFTTILFWVVYIYYPMNEILMSICIFSYFINLINLIPIKPLDGGRITQVIGDSIIYIGYIVLIILVLSTQLPGLALLGILILAKPEKPNYITLSVVIVLTILMILQLIPFIMQVDLIIGSLIPLLFTSVAFISIYSNYSEIRRIKRLKEKLKELQKEIKSIPEKYRNSDNIQNANVEISEPIASFKQKITWLTLYLALIITSIVHMSYLYPILQAIYQLG